MYADSEIKTATWSERDKNLVAEYGDALLCVSYKTRLKTVELIIERKPWTPTQCRYMDSTLVPVRIGFRDTALREKAKAAQEK